jgi:hypothetical protein
MKTSNLTEAEESVDFCSLGLLSDTNMDTRHFCQTTQSHASEVIAVRASHPTDGITERQAIIFFNYDLCLFSLIPVVSRALSHFAHKLQAEQLGLNSRQVGYFSFIHSTQMCCGALQ